MHIDAQARPLSWKRNSVGDDDILHWQRVRDDIVFCRRHEEATTCGTKREEKQRRELCGMICTETRKKLEI